MPSFTVSHLAAVAYTVTSVMSVTPSGDDEMCESCGLEWLTYFGLGVLVTLVVVGFVMAAMTRRAWISR